MLELVIARNPDPDSRLPYLLHVPVGDGLVLATKETWPRTSGLYCHPLPVAAWPPDGEREEVERVRLRACARRGAAIDLVADRTREARSQIVFTRARGREMVFWQSPRTRRQSRPGVEVPTARASGITDLQVVVDSHERYPYTFARQRATTVRRVLPSGDYAVELGGVVVASVERKSMEDLVSSLTSGRLRYALGELAALPRAAVVVEHPYAGVFALEHVRPALVADGLAELQVAFPAVPVVFCGTRKLAEEWTFRWLGAALAWAEGERSAIDRIGASPDERAHGPAVAHGAVARPEAREVRAWALAHGLPVADRGRLRPEVLAAWHAAHDEPSRTLLDEAVPTDAPVSGP